MRPTGHPLDAPVGRADQSQNTGWVVSVGGRWVAQARARRNRCRRPSPHDRWSGASVSGSAHPGSAGRVARPSFAPDAHRSPGWLLDLGVGLGSVRWRSSTASLAAPGRCWRAVGDPDSSGWLGGLEPPAARGPTARSSPCRRCRFGDVAVRRLVAGSPTRIAPRRRGARPCRCGGGHGGRLPRRAPRLRATVHELALIRTQSCPSPADT